MKPKIATGLALIVVAIERDLLPESHYAKRRLFIDLDKVSERDLDSVIEKIQHFRESDNDFWSSWKRSERSLTAAIEEYRRGVNYPERKRGYDDQGHLPEPQTTGRIEVPEYEEIYEIQDLLEYLSGDYEETESPERWQDLLFASAMLSNRRKMR